MNKITYPTPQEALAYAENTGRTALMRRAPENTDWSIFVSRDMLETVVTVVDLTRIETYSDNFFAAIFPPHQFATIRRLLAQHGIKSTVANRAKIMRAAARMEASK